MNNNEYVTLELYLWGILNSRKVKVVKAESLFVEQKEILVTLIQSIFGRGCE